MHRLELALAALAAACLAALAISCADDARSEPRLPERPPVVLLILDEFPLDTIVGPDGRIDAERFPNFARLAGMSTWFPNAHTIYDSTFKAVPAIFDAVYPRRGTAPDIRSHRHSIYTLFDRLGYGVVDVESGTAVCPPRICRDARTRRPGVLARLAGGGRPARLRRWIGAIRKRPRPTLYVQHALLPHEPWIYLPSGRQSRPKGNDPVPGINREFGFHDPELSEHNHMRHLLQVGYVDHELGVLLDRMEQTGVLERSLLVVTADHGYAFEVGVDSRRFVTQDNVDEIAPVALFVKRPGQREGDVNDNYVRNIDIVPTVADILDVRIDWDHDGHSAFSEVSERRDAVRVPTRDFRQLVEIEADDYERRRAEIRRRRAAVFGTGATSALLYGDPWASLYRTGTHPELLGRRVEELPRAPARGASAWIANEHLWADAGSDERIWPTRVTGRIDGGQPGELRHVAAAVNGRIRATGRSFRLKGRPREFFSMLVPEDALRRGPNRVQVFEVRAGGALAEL